MIILKYDAHHCDNCQLPVDWDVDEEFDCGDCACHDNGGR